MPGKKQDSRPKSGQEIDFTVLLSILSLIGIGLCTTYLLYGDNLYTVGKFWPSPVLITLICNEIGKYLVYTTFFRAEKTLNPRESVVQRKKKSLRQRLVDCIKFAGVIGLSIGAYGLLCISLGAPATEHHEETLTLASVLTILTVLPLTVFLGPSGCLQYIWTESFVESGGNKANNSYMELLTISAAGAIFGAWSASIVAPLDWDRQWQVYPIPNIVGALLGYALGDLGVLFQKLITHFIPSFNFIF
uniref:Putative conserved plasma membrane protein n=1 Tax=Nyssomyia neivai TaxID=330878 RepID=A0A1L8D9C0_9DIPT